MKILDILSDLWHRRPALVHRARLIDLEADAMLAGVKVPKVMIFQQGMFDDLWWHRPILTTYAKRENAVDAAYIRGYLETPESPSVTTGAKLLVLRGGAA